MLVFKVNCLLVIFHEHNAEIEERAIGRPPKWLEKASEDLLIYQSTEINL